MRLIGADGTVAGAAPTGVEITVAELGPVPTEFFAYTLKSYATPFVSPVMVAPVVVLTPSLNVANELVPFLNLMTQSVIGEPPLDGAVHDRDT